MDRAGLLGSIEREWAEWQGVLSQVAEAQMERPGVEGEWSVKDIVAHIAWFEHEMIGMLRARRLVGSELWDLPGDERNAVIFEQNRHRPLAEVLDQARRLHEGFVAEARTLTDEEIADPARFADMPPDWVPGEILAQNTFEHYRDHRSAVREWMRR